MLKGNEIRKSSLNRLQSPTIIRRIHKRRKFDAGSLCKSIRIYIFLIWRVLFEQNEVKREPELNHPHCRCQSHETLDMIACSERNKTKRCRRQEGEEKKNIILHYDAISAINI
ncbi:CLUMA_CG012725, isoform A [Clunio marinus]|uniref:CLUMA_CG012725, isoform A n=1 Tax=Clunio marinus TaxID=568069 RepID=A0A1J1IGB7_9DIPT|nr:CLUMA_CG012725, isoform A [Clunio marinus]